MIAELYGDSSPTQRDQTTNSEHRTLNKCEIFEMAELNGSAMGLVLLGELKADSRHTIAAIDRLTEAMADQNNILIDLPDRIAERLGPMMTATQASANIQKRSALSLVAKSLMAAKEVMPPLKEIVWALIILAGTLGWIAPPSQQDRGSTAPTHTAE